MYLQNIIYNWILKVTKIFFSNFSFMFIKQMWYLGTVKTKINNINGNWTKLKIKLMIDKLTTEVLVAKYYNTSVRRTERI